MKNYEIEIGKIKEENEKLLKDFSKWLLDKKLKQNTIEKHIFNVNFFINEFLLTNNVISPNNGFEYIDEYFGNWFIKKAIWSTNIQIKNNSSSIKKFYSFLHAKNIITKHEFLKINNIFKKRLNIWLETINKYDDSEI